MVIKFIRVRGGADIDDVELPDIKISDEDIKCASDIIDKLNATFGVGVPKEEARKLANLIALKSTNKEVAVTNSEYREFVVDVVKKVKDKLLMTGNFDRCVQRILTACPMNFDRASYIENMGGKRHPHPFYFL